MIHLDMRVTPRLVRQIAALERSCGYLDRISEVPTVCAPASDAGYVRAISAAFLLEGSAFSEQLLRTNPLLEAYSEGHRAELVLSREGLDSLYLRVSREATVRHRTSPFLFTAPAREEQSEEILFQTISPFLVEKRLGELLSWLTHELATGTYHPVIVIGVFHLLFLQIHPYATANHRYSLLLVWQLLRLANYSFVERSHFLPYFINRERAYYSALRQAEKTANSTWATINIWLEFFAESLNLAVEELLSAQQQSEETNRLTSVQKRILSVVQASGAATREKIARDTGINISTVKYNLAVLSERGQLKREGGGRGTTYRVL